MLGSWLMQSDELIKTEIDSSIQRLQIDESLFYVAFMTDDCCNMKNKFQLLKERLYKDDPNPLIKIKTFGSRQVNYYEGKIVLAYLLDVFNQTRDYKLLNLIVALVFGVTYASVPGYFRLYDGLSFHGSLWFEIVIFYLNFIFNTLMMLNGFMFFTRFLTDMRRRHFMLQ